MAMTRGRPPNRETVEEIDDGGGPPGQASERGALPVAHRLRTGQAAPREVLHKAEKKRQVALAHALLAKRENEGAAARVQEVVGVLDAFGDAFARQHRADVVGGDE